MAKTNKRTTPNRIYNRSMRVSLGVRGRISNDTTISGNTYSVPVQVTTDGTDSFLISMNPGVTNAFIASSTIRSIATRYSEYCLTPSTTFHWEPRCPLTATGNYWLAWSDNPDFLVAFLNATTTQRVGMVKTISGAKCYPIWQAATIRMGPPRRKWFTVDASSRLDITNTVERQLTAMDFDRTTQGTFFYAVEGAVASTTVAICYLTETYKVRGLLGALPAA